MILWGHSSWVAPPSIWMTFWFSGSDGHRVCLKSPCLGFVLSPMDSSLGIPSFIPWPMDILPSCRFIQFLPCAMLLSHRCVSWMTSPCIPRWSNPAHLSLLINEYLGANAPLLYLITRFMFFFIFCHWSFNLRFQMHGLRSFWLSSYHPHLSIYRKSSVPEDP